MAEVIKTVEMTGPGGLIRVNESDVANYEGKGYAVVDETSAEHHSPSPTEASPVDKFEIDPNDPAGIQGAGENPNVKSVLPDENSTEVPPTPAE